MSSKRPFGKITKGLKKQQPNLVQRQAEQQKDAESEVQNINSRPAMGKLKLDANKPRKNIYDAVKKIDEDKEKEVIAQGPTSMHKPTLSFKKNKLSKSPQSPSEQGLPNQIDPSDEVPLQPQIPRPTPVFTRNKGKLLTGARTKQQPVISQQREQDIYDWNNNNDRLRQRVQVKQKLNNQPDDREQQPKRLIKPNLFKGVGQRKPSAVKHHVQQKPLNNSQVYQQYEQAKGKQKFDFQKMMSVQNAEVRLGSENVFQVSSFKKDKQAARARELSTLINLEEDLYEQTLSVGSTTAFEVYIGKIKAGFLKNSADQAFDEKVEAVCQTLNFENIDFGNQCPQDYQVSHGYHYEENPEELFKNFIFNLAPVIEELIRPASLISMPPTSLLAFSPTFINFLKCPTPIFVYYSESFNISFLVVNEKLYITEDQISCAYDMGGIKLAGLKNGRIVIWNGQNNRNSSIYNLISDTIQSSNFQLPAYSTNDFDRLSPYMSEGAIVQIQNSDEFNQFFSFDSTTKMIKWKIQKMNKKTILVPKQMFEFSKILQKRHLVGFGLKKRRQIFYVYTSSGLLCWNGQRIIQKIQIGNIREYYLPKRQNLILILTQFNTIKIYALQKSQCLDEISLPIQAQIQQIIIPHVQIENRQISILYQICFITKYGDIYEIKFSEYNNIIECHKISSSQDQDQQNIQYAPKSRKNIGSNILYSGINLYENHLQKIKLFKDLKCTSQIFDVKLNLQKTISNFKTIHEKNKKFNQNLEQKSTIFV